MSPQVWPYMEVSPTRYRFRVLNGCNARFLRLSFLVDGDDEGRFDDDCDGNRPGRDQIKKREVVEATVVMTDGQAGQQHQAAAAAAAAACLVHAGVWLTVPSVASPSSACRCPTPLRLPSARRRPDHQAGARQGLVANAR